MINYFIETSSKPFKNHIILSFFPFLRLISLPLCLNKQKVPMRRSFTLTLTLVLLFLLNGMKAQTVQYGRVVEINSKGKSLSNVSINIPSAPDCQPTASNSDGVFRLVFNEHRVGDVIHGIHIDKYGYELVNHHIVHEGWTLTEKDTLRIVMAPKGSINEARTRYYNYLEEAYLSRFDSTTNLLQEQLAQQQISEQEYQAFMGKAVADLETAFQHIDDYADQLARFNQDDSNLPIDVVLNAFIDLSAIPASNPDVSVANVSYSDEFDFLFKGMDFIEICNFFGNFYLDLERKDIALSYYQLALQMCETLDGYQGTSFTSQIEQLHSTINKINK